MKSSLLALAVVSTLAGWAAPLVPKTAVAQAPRYCFESKIQVDTSPTVTAFLVCPTDKQVEDLVKAQGIAYIQGLLPTAVTSPIPLPTFPTISIGRITTVDMDGKGGFIMVGYVIPEADRVDIHTPPGLTYATNAVAIPAAPIGSPKKWVWNIPKSLMDGKPHPLTFTISYIKGQNWAFGEFDNANTPKPFPFQMPGPVMPF